MKTHLEFARDFEQAGNGAMSEHHREKAALEYEKSVEANCGLFCTLFNELLGSGSDSTPIRTCRDPIFTPPGAPPRC